MSDKKVEAEQKPAEKGGKSPMMGYLIFGVVCIALIAGAAFGTLFVMQKMQPPAVAADSTAHADTTKGKQPDSTHAHQDHEAGEAHHGDHASLSDAQEQLDALADSTVASDSHNPGDLAEQLNANMEALESEVAREHAANEHGGPDMSVEDSVKAAAWLAKEESRLATKEKELNQRSAELDKQEKSISAKISRIEQAESSRISNLAKVYDGMDAGAVAKLMANLDDETVVSVLPRMKQKNASAVLSMLPAQRAASLSKQMITIAEQ